MDIKEKKLIYDYCFQFLKENEVLFTKELAELTSGAENDSKSSSGDKHETARAMMQLEHEKISRQKELITAQIELLNRIDLSTNAVKIALGSFVKTDHGSFFISVPIGKIQVDKLTCYVISPQSPLGVQLLSARIGETIELNGNRFKILSFC